MAEGPGGRGLSPPGDLPPIPGYRVLEVRGAGAFGLVLRARCQRLGREVAIKLLKDLPGTPTARDRFLREARLLVGVREEGLIPILDAELASAHPYLVLPWMAGGDLASRIAAGRPPPPDEVLASGVRLARALGSLHRRGILHRDIKPANVLLDERGGPWLSDLGLGKGESDATLTGTGHLVGTPRYLAPELLTSGIATPGTDVFALGVTLVELATGRAVPGMAGSDGTLHRILEGVEPPALRRALRELVAMDPADRPADGDRAAAVLAGAANTSAPVATFDSATATATAAFPPLPSHSRATRSPRSRALVLAGSWSVALVLAGFWAATYREGPAGPTRPPTDPWEEPDLEGRFRAAVAAITPSQLKSYQDPAAWPDLVARLPAAAEFQAWVATGAIGPGGLDRALAKRLAALDGALEVRALPTVFGAPTRAWPTERGVMVTPAPHFSEFVPREVGGWFATGVGAAREIMAFYSRLFSELQRVVRGEPGEGLSPTMLEVARSLRLTVGLLGDDSSFQRHALAVLWLKPEFRRDLQATYGARTLDCQAMMYALGQSMRHEPATRDLLVEWLFGWESRTLRLATYSVLGYEEPGFALGGPMESPPGQRLLAMLLADQAEVRRLDEEVRKALVSRVARASIAALERSPDSDPLAVLRVGRAFGTLLGAGIPLVPPTELHSLWETRIASVGPVPADLARMVGFDLGQALTKSPALAQPFTPLIEALKAAAAAAEPRLELQFPRRAPPPAEPGP